MSRINTNISSLNAQQNLAKAQSQLQTSLQRLSSGVRINTAADDPAGLIISQLLKSQQVSISRAVSNTQRATNVIATTEGALNEVNSLLVDIRDKLVESASTGALSATEIQANQMQINSAVDSIQRIANSTQFGGATLLNGLLDYVYSGIPAATVSDVNVYAAQFAGKANVPVTLNVTHAASAAKIGFAGAGLTAAQTATIEIAGNKGSQVLSFVGSTHSSAIVFAINAVAAVTGVSAAMSGATGLALNSQSVGSSQFVAVTVLAGQFVTTLARKAGSDAVVAVNGTKADATGNVLNINSATLQAQITLKATAAAGASAFYITGGGALFQIGPNTNITGQYNIGVQSINPGRLGGKSVGFLNQIVTGGTYSLANNGDTTATNIVDQAISQVSTLRGRLGALQANTLNTNVNSLNVALQNLTAANSSITDADFAAETANMSRAQILVSAGTSVLATSNTIPQSVLKLLQ